VVCYRLDVTVSRPKSVQSGNYQFCRRRTVWFWSSAFVDRPGWVYCGVADRTGILRAFFSRGVMGLGVGWLAPPLCFSRRCRVLRW